jgi:hypothetical protein
MDQQPRNLAAHAVDDLIEGAAVWRASSPTDAIMIDPVTGKAAQGQETAVRAHIQADWRLLAVELIRRSQHFLMPMGGRLFDELRRDALQSVTGLPFPVICIEFPRPSVEAADNNPASPQGGYADAELVLACQGDSIPDIWRHLIRRRIGRDSLETEVLVVNVARIPSDGSSHWYPEGAAALIDLTDKISGETKDGRYVYKSSCIYTESIIGSFDDLGKERAREFVKNILECLSHAVTTLYDLLVALSCKNVDARSLSPPEKLNKRRIARGKQPFFSYHVLDLFEHSEVGNSIGGSHASPRLHWRRGHVRRLPTGRNVWVRAALVGNPALGFVDKDYSAAEPRAGA